MQPRRRKHESRLDYYARFDFLCIDEFLNCESFNSHLLQEFFKHIDDVGKYTLAICCQSNPTNWAKLFGINSFGESVRGRILQRSKIINVKGRDLRLPS